MNLRIHWDDRVSARLRTLGRRELPQARFQMTRTAVQETLLRVIEKHPVDTGRSSAAWSNALEQLGGSTPLGGRGRDPDAVSEGRQRGFASLNDGVDHTLAQATNAVKYVPFLEYGTRRMPPIGMVRSALAAVARLIPSWFRFPAE